MITTNKKSHRIINDRAYYVTGIKFTEYFDYGSLPGADVKKLIKGKKYDGCGFWTSKAGNIIMSLLPVNREEREQWTEQEAAEAATNEANYTDDTTDTNDTDTNTTEMEESEMTIREAEQIINAARRILTDETKKARSAWKHGVMAYADEIMLNIESAIIDGYMNPDDLHSCEAIRKASLNGARNWREYSFGGCSLIYNGDIARQLCSPSELKKTRNGERQPNSTESWLDVQARALSQAENVIRKAIRKALEALEA